MEINEVNFGEVIEALRLRRGDSDSIEVKRAANDMPKDMGRTVAAFANMPDGGTLIFGVDERSGFVVTGVKEPAVLEAALTQHAREQVEPTPHMTPQVIKADGKTVLVVQVRALPLSERPARYQGVPYLRQSDGEYAMQPWELRMLESQKSEEWEARRFDSEPVRGVYVEDLARPLVDLYVRTVRAESNRLSNNTDEEILRRTGVVTSTGELSLAGLYALGDYPQGSFPALSATAAVQLAGGGPDRNRNLQHFEGPIPVMLDDIMSWCEKSLDRIRRYRTTGGMEDVPELPMSAIRELVSNALVHRDLSPYTLSYGKSIQIRLSTRSLMILSPGGLRGVSVDQLNGEAHAQAAVNQSLYAIARRMVTESGERIIEGEGGGIRHVLDVARYEGLRRPQLVNSGLEFKALLWRPEAKLAENGENAVPRSISDPPNTVSVAWPPTKNEPVIAALLKERGPLTKNDLIKLSGLNTNQVHYVLANARLGGRIIMEGSPGRFTTYRLVSSMKRR